MPREHIHFVTGRLAEYSLRELLEEFAPRAGFDYSVSVLGISVAALMTPAWVARRLKVPREATRILLPGACQGDLAALAAVTQVPVQCGPQDLRELPTWFGHQADQVDDYGKFDIEILAEINHVPRMTTEQVLASAAKLRADGADLIDVGCDPGEAWLGVGDVVRALREAGHRVSIDSMQTAEIELAVRAGAELVLSVNASNVSAAMDWGCEVVVVPDTPGTLEGLDETCDRLARQQVPFRIDPILEPIGFGFAKSLARYQAVRERYPDASLLMGIGNLTELTDADSAGVNVLLLGYCQELGIRSVLTTQVIPWARSSVRECDLARRLVHYSVQKRVLPKHREPRLVMLRDPRLLEHGPRELDRLAGQIKDRNYRIFAEQGLLHVIRAGLHLQGRDPFKLLEQLLATDQVDASHAFYLGYELSKAVTALTLGKNYRQDQALDWGFLTVEEISHRVKSACDVDKKKRGGMPAEET